MNGPVSGKWNLNLIMQDNRIRQKQVQANRVLHYRQHYYKKDRGRERPWCEHYGKLVSAKTKQDHC